MNKRKWFSYIGLALFAALALGLWTADLGAWTGAVCAGVALASAPLVLTEEQVKEFQSILGEMKGGWAELRSLPSTFKTLEGENAQLQQQMIDVRRLLASRHLSPGPRHRGGLVTIAHGTWRLISSCTVSAAANSKRWHRSPSSGIT